MRACAACIVWLAVLVGGSSTARGSDGYLTVKDGRFLDPSGRHVILHGINIGAKHKNTNYLSWHGSKDFARMRRWGFNCVRLLIIWAAIEPECGKYNDEFLARIDERIAWAKANGLHVLLDMHQDLWGEKCRGDGAPAWATLDKGRPDHRLGIVWSDGYLVSPMIQTSFDSFWANKPGPDGVGIQDRFALAWQHVAKRYADEPTVIGYDLFNEPIPGSQMLMAGAKMFPSLFTSVGDGDSALVNIVKLLGSPSQRGEVFGLFADIDVYRGYIDSAQTVYQWFERNRLGPMYQRVVKAIRRVDKRHIVFVEPSVSANEGVISVLEPTTGPDGRRDPLLALAPHAYDIVTEIKNAGPVDDKRIEMIYRRHQANARRMNMPMLIGEWGALNIEPNHLEAAQANVRMIEATLAGNTYWYFSKGTEKRPFFKMLQRPYPSNVAGRLLRYHLDTSTGKFTCSWREDPAIKQPTCVYVPANWYPAGHEVTVDPPGQAHRFERIDPGDASGFLLIAPTGKSIERRLEIRVKR